MNRDKERQKFPGSVVVEVETLKIFNRAVDSAASTAFQPRGKPFKLKEKGTSESCASFNSRLNPID